MTDIQPQTTPEGDAQKAVATTIDYALRYQRVFLSGLPHMGGEPSLSVDIPATHEAAVLVLTGQVNIKIVSKDGGDAIQGVIGHRLSLFDADGPEAAVIGPRSVATILPVGDSAEVLLAWTGIDPDIHATRSGLVREEDVRVHEIGEAHYERTVHEILGESQGLTTRLCIGETEQAPGKWSSWPHHEFDLYPDLATQFDEVFLVYAKPVVPTIRDSEVILRRRGIMVDGTAVDDVLALPNGAEVRVPLGYHPICAPLAARLRYVWAYAGPQHLKKRYAKRAKDNGYYA